MHPLSEYHVTAYHIILRLHLLVARPRHDQDLFSRTRVGQTLCPPGRNY